MLSLKSPSEYLTEICRRVSAESKLAFLSAFISGLLCHLFIFTNSMYNNDDIRRLYTDNDRSDLGRWLLSYISGISSDFSLPVVNGILGLLWLSLAAMVLVSVFKMKNRVFILLTGALLAVFPSVAAIYSYMFTADPYFFACLLSVLAVYFVTSGKRKYSWIAGAVLLCCSMGIYQSYLSFTLLLLVFYYLLMLLQPEKYDNRTIITAIPSYLAMLVCGVGTYYIGLQITLKVKGISLSEYQGIGESAIPGFTQIRDRMVHIFRDFYEFFKAGQILALNGWIRTAVVLCVLLGAAFLIMLYLRNRIFKSRLRSLLILFCIVCIPICINIIYLISDGVTYHMLMRHSWCLLFIAVLIFCENAVTPARADAASPSPANITPSSPADTASPSPVDTPSPSRAITSTGKLLEWGAALAVLVIVWNFVLLNNIAYFNMNFRYEKTYALCLKIVDRLEQQEDYDNDRPIAFIGRYSKTYKMEACEELLEPMTGMKDSRVFMGTSRAYLPFMQNCLGEDITTASPEQEEAIRASEEFQSMPRFPHEGSIRVIDGITVVKLND